jgi:hypothetical protein
MSEPTADDAHEFVIAPESAQVAKRHGVPPHTGAQVRWSARPVRSPDGRRAGAS